MGVAVSNNVSGWTITRMDGRDGVRIKIRRVGNNFSG